MEGNDKYLGRILDNRYEILELIGVGGMAYVYKALCHRLNRLVAIKILKEDLANDEEFQRRFYTESQAVAMLSHPNIVAVYDVSRSGSTEYIVMELIEGITLKQYINRKGLLNWKEALHFATQITKALAHAHSRGIIHRDIKPHNIMILKDGSVKVADFGIARLLSVQNTLTQEALGSVHYISPEQAKGGQIDARSDIYSVGVVMYEMLTSRLPFVGDSAVAVAIQHISAIPLLPRDINPDIPIGLEEITMHAMEPDIHTRFTTAEEMLNDLEEFRKHPGIMFNYAMSNPGDRQPVDMDSPYETRFIPKESMARSDMRNDRQPYVNPRQKPEMTSNEYRDAKRRSSSTATLVGVFAVVVFIVALVIWGIFSMTRDVFEEPGEQITIPDFVADGRRYQAITSDEDYLELFRFEVSYEASDDILEDHLVSQRPLAGITRPPPLNNEKITITLVVSTGDVPPVDMLDLIGLHHAEARDRLRRLNLDLDITTESVPGDEERGIVVETIPSARGTISKGDSVVLRYSEGPVNLMVDIPDLVGSTEDAVRAAFRDLDVVTSFESGSNENWPEGIVYHISNAGRSVPAGTSITIFISTGPTPTPTPPPPPDPPPQPPPESPEPTENPPAP